MPAMAWHPLLWIGLIAALSALGAAPSRAQTPPTQSAAAQPAPAQPAPAAATPGPNASKDFSVTGNGRKDTVVLRPKDGDTLSIRLPIEGQVFVNSLIPWAVTGGKPSKQMNVNFGVRGLAVQHTGNEGGAKASFTLRLIDGRTITINVRAVNAKYKVGYAIIT
jgi:hypothetical protein